MNFKQRLEACLLGLITLFADDETPLGCLMIKSLNESDSAVFSEEVTNYIREVSVESTQVFIALFTSEIAPKDIPENTTIETMVNYVLSVVYGLAVQARVGQAEEALKAIVIYTLDLLPNGK